MKKFLVFIAFLTILLSSCQKKDDSETIDFNSDDLEVEKIVLEKKPIKKETKEQVGFGPMEFSSMYIWNNSIVIETGVDYFIFSKGSEYLSRLKVDGIGVILDLVTHNGVPYAVGIDEKGYELRYKKGDKWTHHKLPKKLENSFDVSPVVLLSDLNTLVLLNSNKAYILENGKWKEKTIPEINVRVGELKFELSSIYDKYSSKVHLLNNKIFVSRNRGEWGGGVIELDLKVKEKKWRKTAINTVVNEFVKDSDRNLWAGASIGYSHAGVFKYIGGEWEQHYPDKFIVKGKYYQHARERTNKECVIVSENGEPLILAGNKGVFKYKNGKEDYLTFRKEGAFFPEKVVVKDKEVFFISYKGVMTHFIDGKKQSSFKVKIKEKKYNPVFINTIKEGSLDKLKKELIKSNIDYNWETILIDEAIERKKFDIARYLIKKNKIAHRGLRHIRISLLDIETLKVLLDKGYRIKLSNIGVKFNFKETKDFLLKNVKILDVDPNEAGHLIKISDDLELIQFYFDKGFRETEDKFGQTGLHDAVYRRNLKKADFLLKKGYDINARSSDGYETGATPLILAVKAGDVKTVKFLIKNGVYVTLPDATGNSPLFYAKTKGEDLYFFKYSRGVVVEKGNDEDYKDVEKLLAKAEKKIGEKERKAVSKMVDRYRLESKHAQLLDAIVSKNIEDVKKVLNSGFNIEVYDKREQSVLMSALSTDTFTIEDRRVIIKKGDKCSYDLGIFKLLVDHSIKTTGKIFDESAVFNHAAYCGFVEGLDHLVKNGANINIVDEFGRSLVFLLALNGDNYRSDKALKSALFLVKKGADLNIISHGGRTILDELNRYHQNKEFYKLIKSHGAKTTKEIRAEKKKSKNKL